MATNDDMGESAKKGGKTTVVEVRLDHVPFLCFPLLFLVAAYLALVFLVARCLVVAQRLSGNSDHVCCLFLPSLCLPVSFGGHFCDVDVLVSWFASWFVPWRVDGLVSLP